MSWGALIGAGAAILGGGMANAQNMRMTGEQHDWAVEDAATNRAWQEAQSSTAHQREVTDLRAAGLNPILSANKGASTGGGATASSSAIPAQDVLGKGVASAIDAIRLKKEIELADKQGKLHDAQAVGASAAAMRDASTAKQNDATTKLLNATFGASAAEAKTRKSQAEQDLQYQNFDNLNKRIQNGLNSVNSAKDAMNPLRGIPIRGERPGLRRNESIINHKTGEVIRERNW